MKFLDELADLKHIVMEEGDSISLGGIGGGGYGYTKDGEEQHAPFPDSILITLDDKSERTRTTRNDGHPTTFEIIIPESKRAELLALLTAESGHMKI